MKISYAKSRLDIANTVVFDPDQVPNKISNKLYNAKAQSFIDLWNWVEEEVYRVNRLKGWLTKKERRDGELIALIHAEVSEVLEALRKGNPDSEKCVGVTHAEEELADVVIRIMDMAKAKGWNIGLAVMEKIKYNKTRPYKHGGKEF